MLCPVPVSMGTMILLHRIMNKVSKSGGFSGISMPIGTVPKIEHTMVAYRSVSLG